MKNFSDFLNKNEENLEEARGADLPVTLVLKRKSVRSFPNGQTVGMYYSDALKRYIAVPAQEQGLKEGFEFKQFDDPLKKKPKQDTGPTYRADIIIAARKAVKEQKDVGIKFADGGTTMLDQTTARLLTNLYDRLNRSNRMKLNMLIRQNLKGFYQIVKFAIKFQ